MPKTKQSHPPLRSSMVRRYPTRFASVVRALAGRLPFLARFLNFLYALYPDAAYLATLRPQNALAAAQLGRVAQGLSGAAQTVQTAYQKAPPQGENFNWVVDTMQANLCAECPSRSGCWSQYYDEMMQGLFALKPILQQTERVGVEQFSAGLSRCAQPAALASEMTRAYAIYRGHLQAQLQADALRHALAAQYSALASALQTLGDALAQQGVPEYHKTRRVFALCAGLGLPPSECSVTQAPNGSLRVTLNLPTASLSEELLQGLCAKIGRSCRRHLSVMQNESSYGASSVVLCETPVLGVSFGVAFSAARGGVSGDVVQQFCRLQSAEMILCDGMGTGRLAAMDGNLAAALTLQLRKADFSPETAAALVNLALSAKSEEESSATLDFVSVDLYNGETKLFKAGAAPGFLVQGGTACAIGATSLPVGILQEVKGAQTVLRLQEGDYAILVSDGMLQGGEGWLLQQLSHAAATGQTPQQIAARLVGAARARVGATSQPPDDMTVAVMQLVRAEER